MRSSILASPKTLHPKAISMRVSWWRGRACLHVGVAGGRLVDFWVVDDEEDLEGNTR